MSNQLIQESVALALTLMDISQHKLGELLNVSQQQISNYLRGKSSMSRKAFVKLEALWEQWENEEDE